jgi:hypothetical protein
MTRLFLLAAALCACIPDNGPLMRPGQDCNFCHSAAGGATPWTAAGTVFATPDAGDGFEGAEVHLNGADGLSLALRSNQAGNFYTRENLSYPVTPCIQANGSIICQQSALTAAQGASCNACHGEAIFGAPQPPLTAP